MFINSLVNSGNAPLVEQMVRFTEKRHNVIAENIANIDTPMYQQKDISPGKFQAALRERAESRAGKPVGSVNFNDLPAKIEEPKSGILFHDGNNRSVEQLMSDLSKNALTHNMFVEFMRKQFSSIDMALKERVG